MVWLCVCILQGIKLTSEQFNAIFTFYDKVRITKGDSHTERKVCSVLMKDTILNNKLYPQQVRQFLVSTQN